MCQYCGVRGLKPCDVVLTVILRRRFLQLAGAAATVPALWRVARADAYPIRPVHWLVGFAPGGPTDTVARITGQWLSDHFGQQFVIENRTGSGGNIAAEAVVNSSPDGYTLLFTGPNNVIANSLYKRLRFDFLRDTVPVAGIVRLANLLVVPPSLPVKTVADLIEYAKANPGKLSFASSGNGTSVHMSAELFKAMTKIEMLHVPYRGSAVAYPDLLSGKVQVLFDNLPGAIGFVRSGQLRGLGVTTAQRWPLAPDIPAIAETVPGYEASVWYGMNAPKGTPTEIIAALNEAVNAALVDKKFVARLADIGAVPMPMTPEQFGKLAADESEKWRKVVEFAGLSIE